MQSTRLQLSWSQWSPLSGKDPKGLCHRRTPRDRAVRGFSTPSRTPVQGPGCPARTRTGFPELNHGLKLSPSTHPASPGLLEGIRPALNPASSRGLQKRGKEKWRGCLAAPVTIQLSLCPRQPGLLVSCSRQGAFLLHAEPIARSLTGGNLPPHFHAGKKGVHREQCR